MTISYSIYELSNFLPDIDKQELILWHEGYEFEHEAIKEIQEAEKDNGGRRSLIILPIYTIYK